MPTLDIFNDDAFSLASLTARVNTEIGYVPGQIGASGLFEEDGVTTLSIMVESKNGNLHLVEPTPRGGPGENVAKGRRTLRSFVVPHYERNDAVMADEVHGVRAFGTETEVETVLGVVDGKMARHTRDLDMTLEFSRVGCVKGNVVTRDGNVLANLYTEFDISAPVDYSFALSVDTTIVRKKAETLRYQIEDELDAPYSSMHAWCGDDFWQALIDHKSVREAYLAAAKLNETLGKSTDRIDLGGIMFERYRTGKKAKAANGDALFIAAGEARVVPMGVPELFITRFAPADYMETVNTKGLPRYSKQFAMKNGKGVELEVQSNHISLCTRPAVLRKAVQG